MTDSYCKGDLIFTSTPFVHILDNSQRGLLCDYCLKRNPKLQRCSRCNFMYFCNRECQSNAWIIHRHECDRLKESFPNVPTNSLRLMANLIFKLKKARDEYEEIGGYCRTFADLESHAEDIKQDVKRLQQFQGLFSALTRFMGEKYIPSPPELFEMFGKVVINAFSILNSEMQIIGSGLYLGASIIDHSCQPNAVATFDGKVLYLRAVEDIPTRNVKMIFISYIDLLETREKRLQQLQEQYYFTCKCIRCSDSFQDKKTLKNSEKKEINIQCINKSTDMLEVLRKMKKDKEDPNTTLNLSLELLKEQEAVMHPINVLYIRTQDIAFDACIELCKWEEALNIGLKTLDSYRYYYGNYHPCLGIQLFRIGKIQLYLRDLKNTEKTLYQAEDILRVSHGSSHPLYRDLLDLIIQCQEEMKISL